MKLAILRAVRALQLNAYGNTILQHLRSQGVNANYGSLYAALERLEAEGLVTCRNDEPTPERGGHPKRYVELTEAGIDELSACLDAAIGKALQLPLRSYSSDASEAIYALESLLVYPYVKYRLSASHYHGYTISITAPDPSQRDPKCLLVQDAVDVFGAELAEAICNAILTATGNAGVPSPIGFCA